mmetsp:Transcript_43920/g.95548  ORF Transcript_43920/g.95548 Transcript_43920/m.95548 type:complete len:126 (-) Transcript_43920:118-495(-)
MVLHVILFDDDEPAPGMSDGGRGAASDVEAPKQPPPQAISSSMLGRHRRVPLPGPWSIMRLPRYAVPKDRNRSRSRDREEKAQDEVQAAAGDSHCIDGGASFGSPWQQLWMIADGLMSESVEDGK